MAIRRTDFVLDVTPSARSDAEVAAMQAKILKLNRDLNQAAARAASVQRTVTASRFTRVSAGGINFGGIGRLNAGGLGIGGLGSMIPGAGVALASPRILAGGFRTLAGTINFTREVAKDPSAAFESAFLGVGEFLGKWSGAQSLAESAVDLFRALDPNTTITTRADAIARAQSHNEATKAAAEARTKAETETAKSVADAAFALVGNSRGSMSQQQWADANRAALSYAYEQAAKAGERAAVAEYNAKRQASDVGGW